MKTNIYSPKQRHLVNQLKKARKDSALDQHTVAKKLGATQSYISKLESGQRKIDVVQLQELAKIYNKPLNYFVK